MSFRIPAPQGVIKLASVTVLAAMLSGCQGMMPVPQQPTVNAPAATATDSEPTVTPTSIIIEVDAVTDTPEPTPTDDPDVPTATPTEVVVENAITLQTVGDVEILQQEEVSSSILLDAEFSPTTNQFATFGYDKMVRIFDAESWETIYELRGHGDFGFSSLAWSPDGEVLASGGGFQVFFWEAATGKKLSNTPVSTKFLYDVSWSPDGEAVAVVGGGDSSYIDVVGRGGGTLEKVRIDQATLWTVAYSPDGQIAVSDAGGRIRILDGETFEVLDSIYIGMTASDLVYSPDGAMLGVCFGGGAVGMYDTSNWSELWLETGHGEDCMDSAFTSTGELFITGGADGIVIAWDAESGAQRLYRNLGNFIWGMSVSFDDRFIVTAHDDGPVSLLGLE